MLRLDHVTVRYGSLTALDDVSLEVGTTERLAVLGPSGSGKSTLLRAVAGLESPSSGTITWQGRDLAPAAVHQRDFGLMFQDYALFPQRDVAGNVRYGLEMRDLNATAIDERVDEVLELVGLAGYRRRRVTELSGGEQQRVALARALAPRPKLLMLDEPLGALDRALRERLLEDLGELFERLDLPILYVTHDQEEALAIGDRVAVLRDGQLEAVASPRELWLRPQTEFVARFLGLRNICTADVDADGSAQTPWGKLVVPHGTTPGSQRLVIRPEGLLIDPAGPVCGIAESVTFRGSRTVVVVAVQGAPSLEVHAAPTAPECVAGDRVCLSVRPDAVHVLTATEPAAQSR